MTRPSTSSRSFTPSGTPSSGRASPRADALLRRAGVGEQRVAIAQRDEGVQLRVARRRCASSVACISSTGESSRRRSCSRVRESGWCRRSDMGASPRRGDQHTSRGPSAWGIAVRAEPGRESPPARPEPHPGGRGVRDARPRHDHRARRRGISAAKARAPSSREERALAAAHDEGSGRPRRPAAAGADSVRRTSADRT